MKTYENLDMKQLIKWVVITFTGVIIMSLLLSSIFTNSPALSSIENFEARYEAKTLELDIVSYELCTIEKEGAKIKLINHFNSVKELNAAQVYALTNKTYWECVNPIETEVNGQLVNETGNFLPSQGGIESFLEVNAAPNVKVASEAFNATGLLYDVKPEVLVCIAQADSSLGNALKTENNIGNVGNTDSGRTWTPDTLYKGIAAIGQTLNNKYLGEYNIIGELSRGGGNHTGSIYASSEYNWNKNVILCLRDINQDDSIDESYIFRTY